MNAHLIFWLSFILTYTAVFTIDMYSTSHRKKKITVKNALWWTALWISIALLYGLAIFLFYPQNADSAGFETGVRSVMAIKFFSGYLTEYSLSIDNLFVFIMIFSLMGVHEKNQSKLLKLGILLSIVLRILFILLGMGLVERFHWIIYAFGAILIYTAYKMAFSKKDGQADPRENFLYKAASRLLPVDPDEHASHFFSRIGGKLHVTALLLAFLVIGSTDVLFAVDSIPAIIGVIKEGAQGILTLGEENFIAITSNVFAVMGLVSLFFALKGIMRMFRYLKTGVSFILFFIGAKMLLCAIPAVEAVFSGNSWISLAVILLSLLTSVILSVLIREKAEDGQKNVREEK
jgi:tellurite resistance protein TerC